jgi:hypothetical protein
VRHGELCLDCFLHIDRWCHAFPHMARIREQSCIKHESLGYIYKHHFSVRLTSRNSKRSCGLALLEQGLEWQVRAVWCSETLVVLHWLHWRDHTITVQKVSEYLEGSWCCAAHTLVRMCIMYCSATASMVCFFRARVVLWFKRCTHSAYTCTKLCCCCIWNDGWCCTRG